MSIARLSLVVATVFWIVAVHVSADNTTNQTNRTVCTLDQESSDKFPGDLFTNEQRRHGGFLFHVFVAFYCFIVIAFVCNDYFLPTVDCICQDLNLSQDVAGATFMALATCTPELFANLIGTFVTESDLGVGAVVGSAVFNTLGVPACGGIAAVMVMKLKVYPLARDCSIYMAVIAVLAIMLWDEHIYWYESLILIILYFVYGIIMFCDRKMSKAAKKVLKKANSFDSSKSIKSVRSDVRDGAGDGVYRPTHFHSDQLFSSIERARRLSSLSHSQNDQMGNANIEANESEKVRLCVRPEGFLSGCWWMFTLPVEIALWLTIPDCKRRRRLYPFSFCMCIVWIGISSYIVSWMMALVGAAFTISDSVMGITFLAMGGSMPEACSSVINSRLGIASMSISNALGANTLDILLCLGLPWMIKTMLPASLGGGPITIHSSGLVYNTAAQIACVAILFIAAALNRFNFNRVLGFVCLFMYLTFIGVIIVIEANPFGWTTNITSSCS